MTCAKSLTGCVSSGRVEAGVWRLAAVTVRLKPDTTNQGCIAVAMASARPTTTGH